MKRLPIINGLAAELPVAQLTALARFASIRWISLDAPVVSTVCPGCIDTGKLRNVYNQAIRADKVWNEAPHLQGQGIGVAVVDSGIQHNYPDLKNQIVARTQTSLISIGLDGFGHGSYVAGIIIPLACIGFIAAEVMYSNLVLGVFVLAPIILIYQAFTLPKLQYEAMQSLESVNHELTVANHAIQQRNDELFLTLAKIFDARDPYVGNHAAQVAAYAVAIATEIGFSHERVEIVRQSGYLHDIGKIAIPEVILHKPAKLTDMEFAFIKKHANIGADFVATSQGLRHLAPFIRHHHERWDGGGYPDGLAGDLIPLEARILNVCDAVEAMASDRPYSRAMSIDEIVAEVRDCVGKQFDPMVVVAFIRVAERVGTQLIFNSARAVTAHYAANTAENDNTMMQYLAGVHGIPLYIPEAALPATDSIAPGGTRTDAWYPKPA